MKCVAVIGASQKRNYFFLRAHATQFHGEVVAIKPGVEKIPGFDNVPVYPKIGDVPGEVDFAFIALPRDQVKSVLQECIQKGVKLVSIFTAEFSDSGTETGRSMERQLLNILEAGNYNTRVLGPNGMGLYYPRKGLAWRPEYPQNPGEVNLIMQSGGLANLFIHTSKYLSLPVGKVFSFGNGIDLDFLKLLRFSLEDPECRVIAGYLEGIKPDQGSDLKTLFGRNISSSNSKPIILLKGGRTTAGSTAAQTHTASLTGSAQAWESLLRQHNIIQADSFDNFVNLILYFHCYGSLRRPIQNICIISLSGGFGVIATDIFESLGFSITPFSNSTQEKLTQIISVSGTSPRNPIDLSVLVQNSSIVNQVVRTILEDPLIDAIYFELPPWYFDTSHRFSESAQYMKEMIECFRLGHEFNKPLVVSIPHVGFEALREELLQKLTQNRVVVLVTPREVAELFFQVSDYHSRQKIAK